jgi:hypothetical protein
MARAKLRHALALGHCRSGVKKYAARHGIALSDITGPNAPGIDTARLRALGDKFGIDVADLAEREESDFGEK